MLDGAWVYWDRGDRSTWPTMSFTSEVPDDVPLVIQSSRPWIPSSAVKNRASPTTVKYVGSDDGFSVGKPRLSNVVLSVSACATRQQAARTAVRMSGTQARRHQRSLTELSRLPCCTCWTSLGAGRSLACAENENGPYLCLICVGGPPARHGKRIVGVTLSDRAVQTPPGSLSRRPLAGPRSIAFQIREGDKDLHPQLPSELESETCHGQSQRTFLRSAVKRCDMIAPSSTWTAYRGESTSGMSKRWVMDRVTRGRSKELSTWRPM